MTLFSGNTAFMIAANIAALFFPNQLTVSQLQIHLAAFSSFSLDGGLNVYISQCFKYIGTIKPDSIDFI